MRSGHFHAPSVPLPRCYFTNRPGPALYRRQTLHGAGRAGTLPLFAIEAGRCSKSALRRDEDRIPKRRSQASRFARFEHEVSAKGKVTIDGTINHCRLVGFSGRRGGLRRCVGRASIRRDFDQSGPHYRASRCFRPRRGNHYSAGRHVGVYAHRAHSATFDVAARRGTASDHPSGVADSRGDPDHVGSPARLLSFNTRSGTCTTASNRIATWSIGRPRVIRVSTRWHDVACHRRHRVDARGRLQRVDSAGRNHPLGECKTLSVFFECELNMRGENANLRRQWFSPCNHIPAGPNLCRSWRI